MTGKPEIEQEWSVYAHLTFSHGGGQLASTGSPGCVRHQVPLHPCYGFQRGNILFTTKPPTDRSSYGSLPTRRVAQPYSRRCMSTCNIVLAQDNNPSPRCHHTVTLSCDKEPSPHSQHPEICEICSGGGRSPTAARRAHTFTSHFCTRVPDKTTGSKDVASQTSQIFSPPSKQQHKSKDGSPAKQKDQLEVPSPGHTPGNIKSPTSGRRLSRSPARLRGKSPLLNKPVSDTKKKPRTVHIDVYCTGSDASCSSDEDDTTSTPQTVYESDKVRVVHTREDERLPQGLCRQKRRTLSETSSSHSSLYKNTEISSDVTTDISSLYPSQRSSMGSVLDAVSSMQSDSLASNVSSSCAIFSDESGPATSWKDTSDVESVRQSDISLAKSESFEYADYADRLRILEKEKAWGSGQKNWRSPEIERKHHLQQLKCQQYIERRDSPFPKWKPDDDDADDDGNVAEDDDGGKRSGSSSSDNSDDISCESEMAWSFGRVQDVQDSKCKPVKREDTVRRASKGVASSANKMLDSIQTKGSSSSEIKTVYESGSLSDSTQSSLHRYARKDKIGPFGKDVPMPKPKLESSVETPFTSIPGKKTDQLSKAEKFGTIIGAFRKPGHHIGPSKNPDCSCENCRKFYEERGYRTRARSMGDMPSSQHREQWKATLHSLVQNKLTEDSGSSECDIGTPV